MTDNIEDKKQESEQERERSDASLNRRASDTESDNSEEIKKVLDDMDTYKYCKTDILHKVNFMSKMDKFIFDSLPLTNSQKEQMLLDLYPNA